MHRGHHAQPAGRWTGSAAGSRWSEETPCAAIVLNRGDTLTAAEVVAYGHALFASALRRNAGGTVRTPALRAEYAHLRAPAAGA